MDAPLAAEPPVVAEQHTYLYKVQMTCGGCSGAVTRVLEKAKKEGAGVDEFTVDLPSKTVLVRGVIDQETLTAKIAKTGKEILEQEDVTGKDITIGAQPVAAAA